MRAGKVPQSFWLGSDLDCSESLGITLERFCLSPFIICLTDIFTGRVARGEGTTQRDKGEVRDAHIPPSPFRFSHSRQFRFAKLRSLLRKRALPFPDSLSPLSAALSLTA